MFSTAIQFWWTIFYKQMSWPILLAMGFIHVFIFSLNGSFGGGRISSLGGDEACAELSVHTLHRASDMALSLLLVTDSGIGNRNNLDKSVNAIQLRSSL